MVVTLLSTEEILDPDLEIVDAHHHLWPSTGAAVSLPPGPGQRAQQGAQLAHCPPYSLDDLCADATSGHRVVESVYIECSSFYRNDGPEHLRPVGESETVAALAAGGGLCAGIVGFADLMLGTGVGEALDAHVAAAGPRFRGIRHTVAWDPDPDVYANFRHPPAGLLGDPRFLAGAAELVTRELSFETWLYFHQLPELAEFAAARPDLTIVLDHLGGPAATGRHAGVRDEVLTAWRSGLIEVSRQPNVVLKLGAVGMRAFSGSDLFALPEVTAGDIVDYWGSDIRFCIDTFGPDRCMFESNFPVDRTLCDYTTLWNAFKGIASGYSRSEKDMLFAGTARAAYRLPVRERTSLADGTLDRASP
ncbi:amidohydrolase family protein [Rhodococcus opacus]|uniref:amidohydrolase family protein n=1 Tax=Rhodococcus opacus TaxID=37919 RepID=UPI00146C4468|nr:amidohydrolase family protein [Rhodococcus opacus]MDV7088939.1 amidohydrolase family protein [Rhodococcus opacus]MDV7088949.1 amidohydrolase family protein [Rhodococcus opacus]WKN60228.1 amidohydrolase family protein [Rhodococcus opacus]WKN60235.1 amidohydrolase family protein [Rhodococcus opacus]